MWKVIGNLKKFLLKFCTFIVPSFTVLGDEKMSSPAGSIKTESSVPFDGFSPLNNDHESGHREEDVKSLTQQLPNVEKVPEVGGRSSPSQAEQMMTTPSSTSMATTLPSVKTETQTQMAEVYRSGSPRADLMSPGQEQSIIKNETALGAVGASATKVEDMEDTSRQSTPVPSHLNPAVCQDEDSQQGFNQDGLSSETSSIFSVRWPKVCLAILISIK